MKTIIILSFIILTGLSSLKAQVLGTSTRTSAMTIKLSEVLDLTVTSGSSITFDFDDITKFDDGIETLNAVTLTYRSNKPWFININAGTANFTGSSTTPMPASVVQFRLNGTSTYNTLSTTPASLSGTSALKNSRGKALIGVDYKIIPGYSYAPAADYGMNITYTISNL